MGQLGDGSMGSCFLCVATTVGFQLSSRSAGLRVWKMNWTQSREEIGQIIPHQALLPLSTLVSHSWQSPEGFALLLQPQTCTNPSFGQR